MASKRKLWRTTTNNPVFPEWRHRSQAEAYSRVINAREDYQRGTLRYSRITVWVDERDGRGWQRFEVLDFASEVPDAG